ncbi:MAG: B12-binding domain-containing radical SAM protein [Salibacteraceae bacterium]
MKVLFSHSYYYPLDDKQWKKKQPYPPLGTIQAASTVRQKGFDVDLFDTNLISDPNLIIPKLDSFQPDVLVLYDDGFNYLTKMCLTNMRNAAFRMIELAKANNIKVLVSSSDSTDQFELYLKVGADAVMLGEADETLSEVLETLKKEEPIDQLKGLAFLKEGKAVSTGKRPVLKNLDQLPMPAWDLIDIEPYRKLWLEGNGYFSLNLATTRGCPFKCNWCAKPIYGQKYNSRSPEHVVNEVEYLINNFGPSHFWMCDDIFGLKPGWVQEFGSLLKAKKLSIKYTIQSRVDLLLKEDTIDALASSGAHEIWVGAESGSQKVLDAMDKGTDVQDIYKATKLLKSKGVRIAFFLQFGYPEETKEDIQKTIDMVTELMPDNIGVSVSYPLPGTPFYDRVKAELKTKTNWEDSDDLDLMFANTYPKDFYRRLQRYIHRRLRLKQGVQMKSFRAIVLAPYYFIMTKVDKAVLDKMEAQS